MNTKLGGITPQELFFLSIVSIIAFPAVNANVWGTLDNLIVIQSSSGNGTSNFTYSDYFDQNLNTSSTVSFAGINLAGIPLANIFYPLLSNPNNYLNNTSTFVPYTGATAHVNLGLNNLTTTGNISFQGAEWAGGNVVYVPIGANIQTYIDQASAGDTLVLGVGVYQISTTLIINKSINIEGQGISVTTINSTSNGFLISNITTVRLSRMKLNAVTSYAVLAQSDSDKIILTDMEVYTNGTELKYGIRISNSNAIIRRVKSTAQSTGQTIALLLSNDNTASMNTTIDIYDSYFYGQGGSDSDGMFIQNLNTSAVMTANIYNTQAWGQNGSGTSNNGVHLTSTTTSNARVNIWGGFLSGANEDIRLFNPNTLNLYGVITEHQTIFNISGSFNLKGYIYLASNNTTSYVPYAGANQNLNLGIYNLTTTGNGAFNRAYATYINASQINTTTLNASQIFLNGSLLNNFNGVVTNLTGFPRLEQMNILTSSVATTNDTVYSNLAGLTLTLSASRTYSVECTIVNSAGATTTGVQLRINTTGTPTQVRHTYTKMLNTISQESFTGTNVATNAFAATGSNNVASIGLVRSLIITGASASTFTIEMKSEVAGSTATVFDSSSCKSYAVA